MTTRDRPFDLVVFGVTSFVGRLPCEHLIERDGTDGTLRRALGGRSAERLDEVAASTGADVERIVADALDAVAMAATAPRRECSARRPSACWSVRTSRRIDVFHGVIHVLP